jgi:hypothetical protein
MQKRRILEAIAVALLLSACAPAGTHYDVGSFTPTPNDACQRPEVRTPGMLSYLNANVGQAGGPSVRAVAVEQVSGGMGQTGSSLNCRATLQLENGQRESGTLSVQDPGAGAPLHVTFESDAAKDRRMDTPERRAIRKHCATSTPQGCALYTSDVTSCRAVAGDAYSILLTQRLWRSKGSSPEEAARLSLDGISRGDPSSSSGDLVTIARRAQSFPLTSQPQEFSDQILNDCIASASQ